MNSDKESLIFKNLKSKGQTMRIYFFMIINLLKEDDFDKIKLLLRIKEFFKNYWEFICRFDEWKQMDLECLIYSLTRTYFMLEEDFKKEKKTDNNEELYELTKKNIISEKKKLINKILLLDKKNGKDKFNNYYLLLKNEYLNREKMDNYLDKLMDIFQKNMKKSFWDIMKQELMHSEPKTNIFINNLKELVNTIVACSPNPLELRKEIISVIDIELIEQMIQHNAYKYEDLEIIVKYVINILYKFQSVSEDDNTKEFEDTINKMIENKENIVEVLVYFMSFTMEKFEDILLIKHSIKKLSNKK